MAFETINLGTHPAGTGGDTARSAFEKTNRNFLAVEVLSSAMSQAQFEANRAQNKERYAASGWVSFGNHESGKQVNECKPGLYTALTTPNTLLIGKAGGVGGSKTDNASVHIDGIVFNLTNQFVLTLPSHPTSTLPERMDMYGIEAEKVEISAASPNAYQGGLRGVGAAVNLFTATDQQKKDFFSANANTTYIGTDGKIYQWQLYKVSFSGTTDGVPSPSEQGYSLNAFGDLWLKAGKNLLYFGNVLRLNDGGYHPSFNPLGAAKFVGDTFWYNTAASITSRADCFNPTKLLAGSGSIATGKSGRPETGGRYFDAIYADGFGGVCRDMRYSANGVESFDYAGAAHKVYNGTYRGFEYLSFTKVNDPATQLNTLINDGALYVNDSNQWNIGDYLTFTSSNGSKKDVKIWAKGSGVGAGENWIRWDTALYGSITINKDEVIYPIQRRELPYYAGGSFLATEIAGSANNIYSTPQLKNGWIGGLVVNAASVWEMSRKTIKASAIQVYSLNNGSTWSVANLNIEGPTNGTPAGSAELVWISQYQAFAKQTEIAPNAVLAGIVPYNVFASSDYRPESGALLGESLIGKVLKNNAGVSVNNKSLLSCAIDGSGKLTSALNFDGVTHQALTLGTPANNSPAFKVVSYLANINQQAVPHFAYTELKHNGTNWGDDGKQAIVDNQSTKPNDNGVTVSVGTARLREPIGWFKNKV
ncbi:hypothetical protein HRJ35_16290 [Shewanella oneidensis MR-1]|uniref:Lambda phage protein of known function n=1 Tax=Shewanella oneidensis (strain ATCC 700550 / JCM 31522 / CIP 106686 / LMG 19005 / NCIMB 14063 / MR-1) TaxID=211586 RepID=Q8ED20_SHEON|nr:Lambda phage protein of known function [Shewanella oneidensis]AAN55964.1 Lambda phage protein of known function [Shewanella oneidensis MR-1]MDX5999600.1 hypothetical protein [Shewanella oneidensis]MEE2027466.1 hypothetical protein [Shewanella oneidensis]QKG97409.1 hypothetical protein HRJ35_16290 [Shewanella oneidensis MR-1]